MGVDSVGSESEWRPHDLREKLIRTESVQKKSESRRLLNSWRRYRWRMEDSLDGGQWRVQVSLNMIRLVAHPGLLVLGPRPSAMTVVVLGTAQREHAGSDHQTRQDIPRFHLSVSYHGMTVSPCWLTGSEISAGGWRVQRLSS